MHPQQLVQELELVEHSDGDAEDISLGELEKFFMKDVGQIRALKKERFSGSWISVNHICVRVKTPAPSVSVNRIKMFEPLTSWSLNCVRTQLASRQRMQVTTKHQFGFEEANLSDAALAWLFTTVFYAINSPSEADLMIPSHNCLFHFSLLIFIFEKNFNKNI